MNTKISTSHRGARSAERAVAAATTVALTLALSPGIGRAQDGDGRPKVNPDLVEAMRELPEHARPLYAVGDVDEDGAIDGADRILITALARTAQDEWPRIADATCPAAADVNLDGVVDSGDESLVAELLGEGTIATPALFHQESLPCRFERLLVASELAAFGGEDLPIWIIRPGESVHSTEVRIEQGTGTVRPGDDDRSFAVAVDPGQSTDEVFLLRIAFSDGAAFYYSLPVERR